MQITANYAPPFPSPKERVRGGGRWGSSRPVAAARPQRFQFYFWRAASSYCGGHKSCTALAALPRRVVCACVGLAEGQVRGAGAAQGTGRVGGSGHEQNRQGVEAAASAVCRHRRCRPILLICYLSCALPQSKSQYIQYDEVEVYLTKPRHGAHRHRRSSLSPTKLWQNLPFSFCRPLSIKTTTHTDPPL